MSDSLTSLELSEFPIPTYQEWRAEVEAALGGAPFEKKLVTHTNECIDIQPIYTADDLDGIDYLDAPPGRPPFHRGTRMAAGWDIAQDIPIVTPEAYNLALQDSLENGQTVASLAMGHSLETVRDLARALDGVDLARVPLFIEPGTLPVFAILIATLTAARADLRELRGALENDPLGDLATHGALPRSLDGAFQQMADVTRFAISETPRFGTIGVRTHFYSDAGGNAVQELAFALATGVEYLRRLERRGIPVTNAAPRFRFTFSVGPDFFMAIAKFRAARMLWSRIISASGGEDQGMRIHARTSLWNRSALDPHVNILRGTTEAFAAVAGGCDSLHIGAFDEAVRQRNEAPSRIARNTQIILREECHLDHVIDPAGGSYYVEALTWELARKAWALFREIENLGGMASAILAGVPQRQVSAIAAAKAESIALRRISLVGVNVYANPKEKPLKSGFPSSQLPKPDAPVGALEPLVESLKATPEEVVKLATTLAAKGATLSELSDALRALDSGAQAKATPLAIQRAAEPFEKLRAARRGGRSAESVSREHGAAATAQSPRRFFQELFRGGRI